jgi:hypothetical protein
MKSGGGASAAGLRPVAWFDCPGGGQVVVDGHVAYVAHMRAPHGTTLCHQPCERITGTEIPVAWFAHGLRVVDIAEPHAPREVAHFLPAVPEGHSRVCSNDVWVDDRGLIYLIDRGRGLHVLERA